MSTFETTRKMTSEESTAYAMGYEKGKQDAAPVVHGRWKICSDGYYPYCSVCKAEPKSGVMTRFCPECGARMDGGEGDG